MTRAAKSDRRRDFRRATAGSVAAEFVLVLPFLIVMFVALFEVGHLMWNYHTAAKTVRDAGRFLGRVPIDCAAPPEDRVRDADAAVARWLALTGTADGQAPYLFDDQASPPYQQNNDADRTPPYLVHYWAQQVDAEPDDVRVVIEVTCTDNTSAASPVYAGAFEARDIPSIQLFVQFPYRTVVGQYIDLPELTLTFRHEQVGFGV